MKSLVTCTPAIIIAATFTFGTPASAESCTSVYNACVKGCPAGMQKGAPAGCTCTERRDACLRTGIWTSWRRNGPAKAVDRR